MKVNEPDQNINLWRKETTVHRAFSGGWREVQRICSAGQLNAASRALLPPMAVELRKDTNGVLYPQSVDLYKRRVELTILTNFYARTAAFFMGLVFAGGSIEWNFPDKLKYLETDIDGEGTSASQFFAWQFYCSMISGVSCCYVNTTKPEGGGPTLAIQDVAAGHRVRFSDVPGTNILGGIGDNVRLLSSQQVPDGEWGWDLADRVYVVSPDQVDLWGRQPEEGEFKRIEGYPIIHNLGMSPASFLMPGSPVGIYTGIPVLDDLAGLQLDHLRTSSLDAQYREACNWLYVHSNGYDTTGGVNSPLTSYAAGKWEDDVHTGLPRWIQYDGQHKPFIAIAEPSGQVAAYNKEKLNEIKENAALWGMMQLRPDGVSFTTATSWNLAQKLTSNLSIWAAIAEAYIQRNCVIAGKMHNEVITEPVCILEKDYSNVALDQFANYLKSEEQGILSKETVFNTLKQTGGIETQNSFSDEQEQIIDERTKENQTINIDGDNLL